MSDSLSQHVTVVSLPLSALSIDAVNVRKTGRGSEPAFAASIRAKGLIEPLVVRRDDGKGRYTITDGGKRFDALMFLKSKKERASGVEVTDDYRVPVIVRDETESEARETSLMANVVRAPMHPVDQFEAFAALIKDGATVDDIAARYVMKAPQVRQALSLASIAPEIREAWRNGTIGGEAAEAYAQTKDLAHQVRVFDKLKGSAGSSWRVNREIVGDRHDNVATMLKFVGQKEFEAAGHHVNHSLFDDDDRHPIAVGNVPALRAMVVAKIEAECAKLKGDGWGWAILSDDAPRDIYAWRRLPPGNPSKEQKSHAGCVLRIGHDGKLEIERGYIKPGDKVRIEKTPAQKKAAKKASKSKEESGGISGGLAFRLSTQITHAAADALSADGPLALRVAVAALATGDSPARIDIHGMDDLGGEARHDNDFDKYFALTAKKSTADLLAMLATWVSRSLSFTCHAASSLPLSGKHDDAGCALLNAIDPKTLNAALRKRFDAADYFKSVSADLVRGAIADMGGKPLASTKGELVEVATALQKKSGWLPKELRTARYDGPAAKVPAAAIKGKRK